MAKSEAIWNLLDMAGFIGSAVLTVLAVYHSQWTEATFWATLMAVSYLKDIRRELNG